MSFPGVISPPGCAARPNTCRCAAGWPGSGRWCPAALPARRRGRDRCRREARIEATTGLQMSHPLPRPRACDEAGERPDTSHRDDLGRVSAREYAKCSHSALDWSQPPIASSLPERGHATAASRARPSVHALTDPRVAVARAAAIAGMIVLFATAWHEQISASPGSAATPTSGRPPFPAPAGVSSATGSAGTDRRQAGAATRMLSHRRRARRRATSWRRRRPPVCRRCRPPGRS